MSFECKKCKHCGVNFKVLKSSAKRSNGAWVRFYADNGMCYVSNICYSCTSTNRYSTLNKDLYNKKARAYNKTRKGLLVRTYRNMKSRVTGVQWKKSHLYYGKELLSKELFYEWALSDEPYNKLYEQWVTSGYIRKLVPSIDRIDTKLGYRLSNMRWVTHSENSKRGATSRGVSS